MDAVFALIDPLQGWLFEALVLPALYAGGGMAYADDAVQATGIFLLGVFEIGLVYVLLRPLEALYPLEVWRDRRALRVDVLYTFLQRAGVLPLLLFLLLQAPLTALEGWLHLAGYVAPNLEDLIPVLLQHPFAAFLVYLAAIDLADYLFHRLQHRLDWWWALHAVHHSQRQLSFWADDRNHVLDDLLRAVYLASIALLIGVPGGQFVAIVLLSRLVESLSHANVRFGFGAIGERLLVSPRFHRLHHGIGVGHEGRARGCNFATLFPVWDILFGTANFSRAPAPSGIRDQLEGADYGRGFVSQQALALVRMARALAPH